MTRTSKYDWCCMSCVFGLCSIASICIAIPTLLYGCNSLYIHCFKYDFADKQVINSLVQTNIGRYCSSTTTIRGVNNCVVWNTYTYYSVKVYFDTCTFQDGREFSSNTDAENYMRDMYPSSKPIPIAIKKDNTNICETQGGLPKNLAIVGFIFGPLSGIFIICFIISLLLCIKYDPILSPNTCNNTNTNTNTINTLDNVVPTHIQSRPEVV
jgi:hypothetical protein